MVPEELVDKLNKLSELRSQNDTEMSVKEVVKGGNRVEIEGSGHILADFDHSKSKIRAGLE